MKPPYLPIVWLLAAALVPAEVSAQLIGSDSPPPESVRRPYRGLFGGGGDPYASQSLTLAASLFAAYDDNVTSAVTSSDRIDPRLQRSGEYYGANVSLNYFLSKTVDRVSFGLASGAAANGYYVDGNRNVEPHLHESGTIGFSLSPRTTLNFQQQVIYSRYYRFQLFPTALGLDDDGALVGNPDTELFRRTALRYGVGTGLRHRLTPRSALNASYRFGYVDYRDDTLKDFRNHGAAIGYTYQVSSYAAVNMGYGYRTAGSSNVGGRPREVHDVNVGMSYGRALSFSRRTSLQFSTGSAIMVSQNLSTAQSDPRARFHLIGHAVLVHELGRTWTARVGYNRGLIFRDGFDEPFDTDAVSAGLGGLVSRRLSVSLRAGWSLASLDQPGQNQHDSFAGSAQATYALSRFLALFANFIYYEYEFGDDIALDPDLPRSLDRKGVRVGLTTSFPLIR
jgi:hypothetical protein